MNDDTPPGETHILDLESITRADMSLEDRDRLRDVLRRLAQTRVGTWLIVHAVRSFLEIRFARNDGELMLPGGRAGALYSSTHNTIVLAPADDHDRLVAVLAHELQHFADDVGHWGLGTIDCEVRANQTQAIVIMELGLRTDCMGLTPSRTLEHPERIRARLLQHGLYDRSPINREPHPMAREHPFFSNTELYRVATAPLPSGGGMRVGGVRAVAPAQSLRGVQRTGSVGSSSRSQASPTWRPHPAWRFEQTGWQQRDPDEPADWMLRLRESVRPSLDNGE